MTLRLLAALSLGLAYASPGQAREGFQRTEVVVNRQDPVTSMIATDFAVSSTPPVLPNGSFLGGGLSWQGAAVNRLHWTLSGQAGEARYHLATLDRDTSDDAFTTSRDRLRYAFCARWQVRAGVDLLRIGTTQRVEYHHDRVEVGQYYESRYHYVDVPTTWSLGLELEHEGHALAPGDTSTYVDTAYGAGLVFRLNRDLHLAWRGENRDGSTSDLHWRRWFQGLSLSGGARHYPLHEGLRSHWALRGWSAPTGSGLPGLHFGLTLEHGPLFPDERLRDIVLPSQDSIHYDWTELYEFPSRYTAAGLKVGIVWFAFPPRVSQAQENP